MIYGECKNVILEKMENKNTTSGAMENRKMTHRDLWKMCKRDIKMKKKKKKNVTQ